MDSNMPLPEYVALCIYCMGEGKYEQTFGVGSGGAVWEEVAPCPHCGPPGLREYHPKALGYIMRDGSKVPLSVVNQIELFKEAWELLTKQEN